MIDTVDRRLLTLLDADPTSPFAVLAQQLDVSERTVSRRYHSLHARGLIRVVGRTLPGFGSQVASRPGAKHTVTDPAPGHRPRGARPHAVGASLPGPRRARLRPDQPGRLDRRGPAETAEPGDIVEAGTRLQALPECRFVAVTSGPSTLVENVATESAPALVALVDTHLTGVVRRVEMLTTGRVFKRHAGPSTPV